MKSGLLSLQCSDWPTSNLRQYFDMTSSDASLPFALLASSGAIVVGIVVLLLLKRYWTWWKLRQTGIPTVYWRPRFINYQYKHGDQQMSSSTITNILPRMKRLQGPYDMYGTVYGISTAVVHVAHPVPALALLAASSSSSVTKSTSANTQTTRRSRLDGCGACKAPAYNHFKSFCGNGVFTADGTDWKEKRAAVSHALLKVPGSSLEAKLQCEAHRAAQKLVRVLQRKCRHNNNNNNRPNALNILPLLQRTTVGLIFRYITHVDLEETLYGVDETNGTATANFHGDDHSTASTVSSHDSSPPEMTTTTTKHPNDEAATVVEGSLPQLFASYLESIVQIRMIILAKSRSIWFLLPQWFYRVFSTMAVDEAYTMTPIRKFSTLACQTAVEGSPLHRLQQLPLYQTPHPNRQPKEPKVSQNLLDEAITLLFAGQDTSAATLSWTLHLLSLSPRVQSKLADEVRSVMRQNNLSGEDVFSKRVLTQMSYLDAAIKESMRLYPVAPFVVRRLPSSVTVCGGSKDDKAPRVQLPTDTVACIWIYSLHRHPDFWSQPNEFLPERWLSESSTMDAGITNGAYMPFAAGPRNCVGQPLAHVILRTLLAQLVSHFEFHDERLGSISDDSNSSSPDAGAKSLRKDMQAGFTVLPKDGVQLLVRERKL